MMPQLSVRGGLYLTMCAAFGVSLQRPQLEIPLLAYPVVIGVCSRLLFKEEKQGKQYLLFGVVLCVVTCTVLICGDHWYKSHVLQRGAKETLDLSAMRFIACICAGVPICYAFGAGSAFLTNLIMQEIRRWVEHLKNDQASD